MTRTCFAPAMLLWSGRGGSEAKRQSARAPFGSRGYAALVEAGAKGRCVSARSPFGSRVYASLVEAETHDNALVVCRDSRRSSVESDRSFRPVSTSTNCPEGVPTLRRGFPS